MINKNYLTKVCIFSYDEWNTDKDKLPLINRKGKDSLSTIASCAQGSMAKGTDGKNYILTGENKWILYSEAAGGGSSGGSDHENIINFVYDDGIEMKDAQFILETI